MKNQNTFYAFLLFLAPLSILGQTTVSLGGNIYATSLTNKQIYETYTTKNKNVQMFLTPNYSVFLTKKLMVGTGATFGNFYNQNKYTDFVYGENKGFSGAFAPRVRYYFLDKSKWRYFGNFSFEYSGSKNSSSFTDLSGTNTSKSTASAWNFTPSVGVNYLFSDDVALEMTLQHSQTYLKTITPTTTNNNDFNIPSLNIGFQNFLTLKTGAKKGKSQKTKPQESEAVQYLHSGKYLVGGDMRLWRFNRGTRFSINNPTLTVNPTVGYFLTKNVVLGADTYLNKPLEGNLSWSISPFFRYYQPILPAFSLFAEGRMTAYNILIVDGQGDLKDIIRNQYDLNLGYNYFLSRRVALEGVLYNYSYLKPKEPFIQKNITNEFGLQAKIRYFLN